MAQSGIPVIDINAADEATIGQQLVDAAEEHGFIYIRNLGQDISAAQVDEAFALLFDAPLEEKAACAIQTNNRGWGGLHSETLDPRTQKVGDFKEYAYLLDKFEDNTDASKTRLEAFRDVCTALCSKLLRLIGNGLGVGDFFAQAHEIKPGDECDTILRLLRYPPPSLTTHTPSDVRAGAHSDYGSITLLFRLRGQAGLEVQQSPDGDSWAPVPVHPPGTARDPSPPILVNVGDLLSYWTGGLLRSTVHRVAFGGDEVDGESAADPRYSIAFFSSPSPSTVLGVVPSERVRNFVPRSSNSSSSDSANPYAERRVMRADEHLWMRLAETYGDLYKKEEKA
ncbi:oxidoreductase, 2OG-Fe(II) oxygenase family, putative [Cordyceps militaris CM01]|uniref:Oxidoreductase, 2OG-Fe(II) oxygenase family, putative n=1 Tax=Cordyceps militaris (strain CM01) TaxID=983644 RepID=G3J9H0_CORMM|nr:oxidoreductase, 2OG-Fe(II) oxygenase family, putative [Cordyceps militaris CM01]EGX94947.1 oxidoreductase, 2OG-Fe(II) oxygenase family, putative [Cordyceps militaris CM01]